MIDAEKLQAAMAAYKQSFLTHWKDEKYKWEAVTHFQEHWDENASDFLSMFTEATGKTDNLLASMNNYPRSMIQKFARADAEATRAMFVSLFDESRRMEQRIEKFMADADAIRLKYGADAWKLHYQSPNAITTYLWLRYPSRYYIYKYSEVRAACQVFDTGLTLKKGASIQNVLEGFKLYDEICAHLQEDADLPRMLQDALTDRCFPDEAFHTMTIDFSYFVSRHYARKEAANAEDAEWYPLHYTPNLSEEDWAALLKDPEIFQATSLEMMKRLKDYGGAATCKQLAVKYGETPGFYNMVSSRLAQRVQQKTGCPVIRDEDGSIRWWPILYLGRDADEKKEGVFIWKLRDELSAALDKANLSDVSLYAGAQARASDAQPGYWWLNANPKIWRFSDIAVGEVQSYTLYNENGNKRRIFQNFLDAKIGDWVVGYESYPVKQIVALARISKENDGERLYFEKTEGLSVPIDYSALKDCPELKRMEYFTNSQGSLFKLSQGEFDFILDLIRDENPVVSSKVALPPYGKADFLSEVYIDEERFDTLIALLKNKKNLILQGAPGVGKTFAARRLAYAMMGEKDDARMEFIQFHQNYSYEDFIMGYKPQEEGFKLTSGVFYQFCQNALNHPDKDYFFIIDEINRGNMSKIFGELLMLIERDYRGTKTTLAYQHIPFCVPMNLYLIGMMNTADRSLAMIDYALRRRFSFFEMEPGFLSAGFKAYQESLHSKTFDALIARVQQLNDEIAMDDSLGTGFQIGHSYFCGQKICTDEWLKSVVYYDILPMLREYWFDDKQKLRRWEDALSGVFDD